MGSDMESKVPTEVWPVQDVPGRLGLGVIIDDVRLAVLLSGEARKGLRPGDAAGLHDVTIGSTLTCIFVWESVSVCYLAPVPQPVKSKKSNARSKPDSVLDCQSTRMLRPALASLNRGPEGNDS
jgi:hypothetical protein